MLLQYNLTKPIRDILTRWNFLGFDTAHACAQAILHAEDWQHTWDLSDADTEDVNEVDNWHKAVLLNNSVNGVLNNLLKQHFGL